MVVAGVSEGLRQGHRERVSGHLAWMLFRTSVTPLFVPMLHIGSLPETPEHTSWLEIDPHIQVPHSVESALPSWPGLVDNPRFQCPMT